MGLMTVVGGIVIVAVVAGVLVATGALQNGAQSTATPSASGTASSGPTSVAGRCSLPAVGRPLSPPDIAALASLPTVPTSDGTTATIATRLGTITFELFCGSSPVAAQNFVNLAHAGFYNGLSFHRLVPGFVIQGGDPVGDGSGGPGYTIPDEPVVGAYVRGIVAMARTSQPNSQGSQFFIVLDDSARTTLESSGDYAIFAQVVDGMSIVDQIATMPNSGSPDNTALDPVQMTQVTIWLAASQPTHTPTHTAPASSTGPAPTPVVYVVQPGDTFVGIADRFSVTFDDLLAANPGCNPEHISVGTKLVLPSSVDVGPDWTPHPGGGEFCGSPP